LNWGNELNFVFVHILTQSHQSWNLNILREINQSINQWIDVDILMMRIERWIEFDLNWINRIEKLYNSLSTQLNNETMCVDCWLEISTLSLSLLSSNIEVIGCIWTVRIWEHTHTHTHWIYAWTHVWKCVERERVNQSNVENGYNLIEINWELQLMFVESSWQNDTESALLSVCVFQLKLTWEWVCRHFRNFSMRCLFSLSCSAPLRLSLFCLNIMLFVLILDIQRSNLHNEIKTHNQKHNSYLWLTLSTTFKWSHWDVLHVSLLQIKLNLLHVWINNSLHNILFSKQNESERERERMSLGDVDEKNLGIRVPI
jgi:hypothetical protein